VRRWNAPPNLQEVDVVEAIEDAVVERRQLIAVKFDDLQMRVQSSQ